MPAQSPPARFPDHKSDVGMVVGIILKRKLPSSELIMIFLRIIRIEVIMTVVTIPMHDYQKRSPVSVLKCHLLVGSFSDQRHLCDQAFLTSAFWRPGVLKITIEYRC